MKKLLFLNECITTAFWLFGLLFNVNYAACNEFLSMESNKTISRNYRVLNCAYDLQTGGRICNCGYRNEDLVLQIIVGNAMSVTVRNCQHLLIKGATFRNTEQLNRLTLENIEDLVLEEYALEFTPRADTPKVKITFVNAHLREIVSHTLNGYVDSIIFQECQIGRIYAFAFNCLSHTVYSFSVVNSQIDRIESQAIKHMNLEHFVLRNTTVLDHLPTLAFYRVNAATVSIENCTFSTISTAAIIINEVSRLNFCSNNVGKMDGEAIHMSIKDGIQIQGNFFKEINYMAFSAIKVHDSYKRRNSQSMDLQFLSNEIQHTDYPIRMLVSNDFNLRIVKLRFVTPMECNEAFKHEHNSFLRDYADTVYFKIGDAMDKTAPYFTLSNILTQRCKHLTSELVVIMSVVGIILLILVITVSFLSMRYLEQRRQAQHKDLVMPEGKTYRETQIVMQIESAGLMKTDL